MRHSYTDLSMSFHSIGSNIFIRKCETKDYCFEKTPGKKVKVSMMQGAQRKFYFNLVYLILDVNCIFTIGTLDFTLHLLAN